MTDNLKDKGWKSMQTLLDTEMPVQTRRPKFLWLLILVLFGSGLLLGWFGRAFWQPAMEKDSESEISSLKTISDAQPSEIQIDNESEIQVTKNDLISENSHSEDSNTSKGNIIDKKNFITSDSSNNEDVNNFDSSKDTNINITESSKTNEDNDVKQVQAVSSQEKNESKSQSENHSIISSETIASQFFRIEQQPVVLSPKNTQLHESNSLPLISMEINGDVGKVFLNNNLSFGIQANALISMGRKFQILTGLGYRNIPMERDYSFKDHGKIDFNPEVQSLTRSSVFYIEDIQQYHMNVAVQYQLCNRFSLRGGVMPTYNVVSGVFLENHPLLYETNNNSYFFLDYSLGTQYKITPSFGVFLNYQSNFKSFTSVEPDQGGNQRFARRISLGFSYLFK